MSAPLPVTADLAGLERFAYQLFSRAADDSPARSRQSARLEAAALDPNRLQTRLDQPTDSALIPLAYRLWLAHLLWLEEVLHALDCRPADVTAVELAGLQAVSRARSTSLRAHQFCPHCQAANPRAAARCRHCGQEF